MQTTNTQQDLYVEILKTKKLCKLAALLHEVNKPNYFALLALENRNGKKNTEI